MDDRNKFQPEPVPSFPGIIPLLGPGIIWMALAQGSGELIWWPYTIAKYGLGFLFLLIPACILQYPLTYEIGRYTVLTGESIWQGFIRLNKTFALLLWILMTVSFLWFGAFASAGGTAIAAITNFPPSWTAKAQTLFWANLSILLFFTALVLAKVIYRVIERIMWIVAIVTIFGLVISCIHPTVLVKVPEFIPALFIPHKLSRAFDPTDATKVLTAITFAGLGGFWTLFYSYWLREKGIGMAKYCGHLTGLISKPQIVADTGYSFVDIPANRTNLSAWLRYLVVDSGVGIFGNIFTTVLTCLLAYAVLFPQGLLPQGWEIAVVQAQFFSFHWGEFGRKLFLFIAAAFLADTWLSTIDAVSRVHTDIVYTLFTQARIKSHRWWYFFFVILLTIITSVTMYLDQPGTLILISAVIGFIGTVIFSVAVLILNHFYLPLSIPQFAKPKKYTLLFMIFTCTAYVALAGIYLYTEFF